jgi:predicted enzyme related to lactoylglutathione lyase
MIEDCASVREPPRHTQTEAGDDSYASGVRRVVSVEPIFVVSDVPRAVAHYEQLGFSTSHHDEGYAFAHRNELTIHLAGPGVEPERMGHGSIYMHVDDADALAEEWRDAGVDFIEPQDFEYGKREGSHQDPDGNLTRFRITSSALSRLPAGREERLRPAPAPGARHRGQRNRIAVQSIATAKHRDVGRQHDPEIVVAFPPEGDNWPLHFPRVRAISSSD